MRQSKYITYAEYKKHLDGDWRTVHNLWRHIRNYGDDLGYSKVEVDAFFEGESGGKKQIDFGNVIGLTQGSISFASAGGALTEANADFNYNSGTKTLSVDTMAFTGGSITDSSGAISFGNENLSTTGTFDCGVATLGSTSKIYAAGAVYSYVESSGGCKFQFLANDNNYGWFGMHSNHPFYIGTNNSGKMFVDTIGGIYIGDTANGNMTVGLTINQGANDNELFAGKSSDIAHGITDYAETDTYIDIKKAHGTDGGLSIRGFSEASYAFLNMALVTTDNIDKDATALGAIIFDVRKKSGTGAGNMGADANLLVIQNNSSSRFIFDEDGDMYYDGAAPANYDDFDDAAACHDLSRHLFNLKRPIKNQLTDFIKYNGPNLIAMGVVSPGGFVSTKGLAALQLGAISQLYSKDQNLEKRIMDLEKENDLLHNKIRQLEI